MKKEVVIIIVGIIALALLYYFVSKKPAITAQNQTGLIPSATTAINKLGNAISVTSKDIQSVVGALSGLLGKKSSNTNLVTDSNVQTGFAYMGENTPLYS